MFENPGGGHGPLPPPPPAAEAPVYYTCLKTRLTENVFPLTPALTLTLTLKAQ